MIDEFNLKRGVVSKWFNDVADNAAAAAMEEKLCQASEGINSHETCEHGHLPIHDSSGPVGRDWCEVCGKLLCEYPAPEDVVAALESPMNVQVGGGHYKGMAIQPIEYIHANKIGFAEGCVIKYVSRWKNKGGVEDLRKAEHFIKLLIELETRVDS